ncbi:hypothetical protein [Rhodococcus marinonascens]|uniref:hypothetical protein n=1 Tax=Rhodococcus marinonascens TaxID=38311 RepID=UPI0009339E87|nr:hypothetical protein [Rhodococcus marinonascens]
MPTNCIGMRRDGDAIRTVDIAGTDWPIHKLEALCVALLAFVLVLVVTQTLQAAVLTAAAIAVVVWWARRLYASGPSGHLEAEPSHGQATGAQ